MMKHVETKFKILMKPGVDHFREMCFVCVFLLIEGSVAGVVIS